MTLKSAVRFCLVATLAGTAVRSPLAQTASLQPVVQGELVVGTPRRYTVPGTPGDLVSTAIELRRARGPAVVTVTVLDGLGAKLIQRIYGGDAATTSGALAFVVPGRGQYFLQISSSAPGVNYTLRTEVKPSTAQTAGVTTSGPAMGHESPRIARLVRDVAAGNRTAVDLFWADVQRSGAPLIEPLEDTRQEMLVTFLWRQVYETHNVLVLWPGRDGDDHYMTRIPNTDVWYRTVRLVRDSRFAYSLAPNDGGRAPHLTEQVDPLNPRSSATRNESLLELPDAPDESWFRRVPLRRGTVTPHRFESALLKGRRDISIYTPPGYSPSGGPYALLILFDGTAYERQPAAQYVDEDNLARIGAPTILDNLIGDGRIRPTIACFVGYTPDGTRGGDLQSPIYPDVIATELVPWLRSAYSISPSPRDVVIGGYSAGAGAAGHIALKHPAIFGNVLLQDGGNARLPPEYLAAPPAPIRFYSGTALYGFLPRGTEAVILPSDLPLQEADTPSVTLSRQFRNLLLAKGYDLTYRETGGAHHDVMFRALLPEGLQTLLGN